MRALLCFMIASSLWGQVTFNRILNANKEPQNWLTYSGTELSQRHSLLTQITPANVKNLELQWVFQARARARKVRSDTAGRRWRALHGAGAE